MDIISGMTRPKTPTIVDIAAAAGVSKSAVSRALLGQGDVSPETRRRVEDAAKRLGYVANAMARGLVSARTKTIGVVLRDVKKPYYAYLQAGMQAQAERRDYRIVTTTNAGEAEIEDAIREITNLISLQVDGLIIAPARLPSSEYVPYLTRVPIVVAGRREADERISSVACDEYEGGVLLGRHVVSLGHRDIAVLVVDENYSARYHARGAGMLAGIRAAGGNPIPRMMPSDLVAAQFASPEGVTAIMCPTDSAAMDVLDVAGPDISVAGFDGYGPLAAPFIGLTTFRQPVEEMGRTAVDLLVDRLEEISDDHRFVSLHGAVIPGRTVRPVG
jgi:DNA-binding LacI/PurR family transcriptional regulator